MLILTPFQLKSEVNSKIWKLKLTPWVKTAFNSGRLTHQLLLNIFRIIFQFSFLHKLQSWRVFHHNFSLCRFNLQISKKNLCFINYFLFYFWHVWGIIFFLSCREATWDQFWWFFWWRSHSHSCFIHLSCRSLRIPPYYFLDSYKQFF